MKLIYLLAFLNSLNVYAEFCFKSFETDTTVARAIFIGQVVEINRDAIYYRQEKKDIFTFKVSKYYKGLSIYDEYISVIGPVDGCCNEHFILNFTYLVFTYGDGNQEKFHWTNDCSNTGPLSVSHHLIKQLGVAKEPISVFPFKINKNKQIHHLEDQIKQLEQQIINSKRTNRIILYVSIFLILICFLFILKKK